MPLTRIQVACAAVACCLCLLPSQAEMVLQQPSTGGPATAAQNAASTSSAPQNPLAKKPTKAKPSTGAAKPSRTTVNVSLPVAHAGEFYSERIRGIKGLAFPGVTCSSPTPALLSLLQFDCADLHIFGMPRVVANSAATTVTLTDTAGNVVELHLTLSIHDVDEVTDLGTTPSAGTKPATASKPAGKAATDPTTTPAATPALAATTVLSATVFGALTIQIDSQLIETSSSITGRILGLPPTSTPPKLRVYRKPAGQEQFLVPLSASGNTVAVAADGGFTVTLASGLQSGERLELELVPPDGISADGTVSADPVERTIDPVIPKPHIELTSVLRDTSTIIAGTALPVEPTPPTGSVAARLPLVEVLVHGYGAPPDEWTIAPLSNATSNQIAVDANGRFSITLATPLSVGQSIKVRALPSPGHFFEGDPRTSPVQYVEQAEQPVYTALRVAAARVTMPNSGATSISGTATPSVTGGSTVNIAFVDDTDNPGVNRTVAQGCHSAEL